MHACLALGFEGIHRTSAGGAANLQKIQRNLYETLRRVKQADRRAVAALAGPVDRRATVARRSPGLGGRLRSSAVAAARRLLRPAHPARRRSEAAASALRLRASRRTSSAIERKRRSGRRRRRRRRRRRSRPASADALGQPADGRRPDGATTSSSACRQPRPLRAGEATVRDEFKPLIAQDRRRAREGAGHDQGRRPHRQRADPHRPLPVELRALAWSARRRSAASGQGRAHASRSASRSRARAPTFRSPRTTTAEGRAKNRRVEILDPAPS